MKVAISETQSSRVTSATALRPSFGHPQECEFALQRPHILALARIGQTELSKIAVLTAPRNQVRRPRIRRVDLHAHNLRAGRMAKDSGLWCVPRRKWLGIPYYRQAKKRCQRAGRDFLGIAPRHLLAASFRGF